MNSDRKQQLEGVPGTGAACGLVAGSVFVLLVQLVFHEGGAAALALPGAVGLSAVFGWTMRFRLARHPVLVIVAGLGLPVINVLLSGAALALLSADCSAFGIAVLGFDMSWPVLEAEGLVTAWIVWRRANRKSPSALS
jgi:hypothetical protein